MDDEPPFWHELRPSARVEAPKIVLEGASELTSGTANCGFYVVGMFGHYGWLTLFEARLHDAFDMAGSLLIRVFISHMHLNARDATRESGESVFGPFVNALLKAFSPMDVMVSANFDMHKRL